MYKVAINVIYEGKSVLQKELLSEHTYTLGREKDKDIVLDIKTVSAFHAIITIGNGGEIYLEDTESSNGIFVQGRKLSPGQRILIGVNNKVMLGQNIEIIFSVHRAESDSYISSSVDSDKSILMSSGINKALNRNKDTVTIGRDADNDIVLNHPTVSRLHAKVTKRGTKFYIKDMGSMNGTFVNSEKINKEVLLKEHDAVYISGHKLRFDWGSMTFAQEDDTNGINVSVENLVKDVPAAGNTTKRLLSNISFNVKQKEFVAVLGVSGAGKSTLVDALCGFRKATGGQVLFNDTDLYNNYEQFKPLIGYVPQADIVHTELTVEEVLTFAARLRLPPETSPRELKQVIKEVIQDLELGGKEKIAVGRLSGGQRKRVSIGVELLTKPTIFFLDEPTSGLDPGMEKNLMMRMRRLAEKGSTIFLITHATLNVDLCDKIVFLAKDGHLAFFGTPDEARVYFKEVFGTDDFADIYIHIEQEKQPQKLSERYRNSSEFSRYAAEKKNIKPEIHRKEEKIKSNVSSFKQWLALTHRYALTFWKDKTNLAILLLQSAVVAMIIVGTLNYDTGDNNEGLYRDVPQREEVKVTKDDLDQMKMPGTQMVDPDKMGDFIKNKVENAIDTVDDNMLRNTNMSTVIAMLVYTVILLGAFNACREIVKEISIYKRERLVNLKIIPYVLSKVVVLMSIFFVQAFLLVLIVAKGLGMPNILMLFVAYYTLYVASMMFGLMISSAVKKVDQAVSIVVVILICQIIFSGALFPEKNIKPEALRYIFWPAISKWSYELVGGEIVDVNDKIRDDRFDMDAFKEKKEYSKKTGWAVLTLWGIIMPFGATCLFLKKKDAEN